MEIDYPSTDNNYSISSIFSNPFYKGINTDAYTDICRCKADYMDRNKLIEDDSMGQSLKLEINIWFACNLYLNCKNLVRSCIK